ncbi:MAG TPA: hypothetical protein VGJ20_17140 [Xanthobacteraceae bacterium]
MRRMVAFILGLALAVNGLVMLGWPAAWYAAVPGVPATGPFNPHFVRHIGAAYLAAGAALSAFASASGALPAAQTAAAFLTAHALGHLWDAAAGQEHGQQLFVDLPIIFLPAALAISVAIGRRREKKA